MIEAILKIPDEILDAQMNMGSSSNKNNNYVIVVFDKNHNIKNIFQCDTKSIIETNSLTNIQKKLIFDFNIFRGIVKFGKNFNRYSFGGKQSLATCSLLHYDFSKDGITSIKLFKLNDLTVIQNVIDVLQLKKKTKYSKLIEDHIDVSIVLENYINNLFINEIFSKNKKYPDISFNLSKIILIPESDKFIEKFILFWTEFMELQSGKTTDAFQNFNIDTFNSEQSSKHSILYSKVGLKKIIFQTEDINKINTKDYEKIEKFKSVLNNARLRNILPLPMGTIENTNNYNICFSDLSLLSKLKKIFSNNYNFPFNYLLISNFDGYQFENITNFNFNINELINKQIYDLKLNTFELKNELIEINQSNILHDKFELLFDISFLFWRNKDESKLEEKQFSFFKPEIKENSFLNQILKENSISIINQIFKNDNNFLNFRFLPIINKILNEIIKNGKIIEMYLSVNNMKRLLLLSMKYEKGDFMKSNEVKKIEKKLELFKENEEISQIESDFEAYYYVGVLLNHLVGESKSSKNKLEVINNYLISASTTDQLKKQLLLLTEKYVRDLKVNQKMWDKFNYLFFSYDFEDKKVKNNLIPIFIGVYSNFWLSKTKNMVECEING
ncbi:MAG: hypothetical protein PHQ98_04175 [Candidatus ainarchaeum sp.]|nr:hypothetical protein [Candidatus ainarchaeum sp.]